MKGKHINIHNNYSDDELINAIKNNDKLDRALDFIYRTHYGLLENLIVSKKGSTDDAKDIVQEVMIAFVDIVQNGKFRGESSVKSFLYALTRNMWYSELRRSTKANEREFQYENQKAPFEQDITDHLGYQESLKFVLDVFESLGQGCKQILKLFYFDGLSMKEILKYVNYENEQVLRNKKHKCQKELIRRIEKTPSLYDKLKSALKNE